LKINNSGDFKYVDTGGSSKETILLLHGLFGSLSNFQSIFKAFSSKYRIIIPVLPIDDMPIRGNALEHLLDHIEKFVSYKQIESFNLLGNSLGGHLAQLYTLKHQDKVNSMILTGSSGLYENSFGGTYLRRGDYEFIKTKTESTFFDPKIATKEMVDEVFEAVNNRKKAIRYIAVAKSAIRYNLEKRIQSISVPTLLIWGKEDVITPPFVAEKFKALISNSKLYLIEKCGHAPMMEKADKFNFILQNFLSEQKQKKQTAISL